MITSDFAATKIVFGSIKSWPYDTGRQSIVYKDRKRQSLQGIGKQFKKPGFSMSIWPVWVIRKENAQSFASHKCGN